jgi:hypothetical protein
MPVNPSFSFLLYAVLFSAEQTRMRDRSRTRPPSSKPRFRPRIGQDFDLEEVHVIDARTRGFLSRAIAIGAGGAVVITSGYGLATGSYVALEVVWAVAGPMFGALVTNYFGLAGKDTR